MEKVHQKDSFDVKELAEWIRESRSHKQGLARFNVAFSYLGKLNISYVTEPRYLNRLKSALDCILMTKRFKMKEFKE